MDNSNKTFLQKIRHHLENNSIMALLVVSAITIVGLTVISTLFRSVTSLSPYTLHNYNIIEELRTMLLTSIGFMLIYLFFTIPFILTLLNIISLFINVNKRFFHDIFTIVISVICLYFYLQISEIKIFSSWDEQLINNQVHSPFNVTYFPAIVIILILSIISIIRLQLKNANNLPPLQIVLNMSVLYMGLIVCIISAIHLISNIFLFIVPFNYALIISRVIINTIKNWNVDEYCPREYKNEFLNKCSKLLTNSKMWPLIAFFLMWPLLGILVCILVLFGQQPDALIKAYTETSDWTLSQHIAPPNLVVDEHYLCTVAAGGHEKVVKPIRMGVRHGHSVVVNRQLCVANAFEQILEERTPRFHRVVRNFYDKYGFPVAKLIHSRYIADIIYFIMKPLEWIFLIVLYLCDKNPENRIAMQYLPRSYRDFQ